jgi:Amt family ammonium transporter
MLVWVILDYIYFKRPAVIGAIQGIITGLVAITPAAGFVAGWGAFILGICSGSIPWVTLNLGKRHISALQHVDDTLDVFHTHFVAAIVGGFLTGLFATSGGTAAFGDAPTGGAIAGNGRQVWVQIVGALFVIGWCTVWTSLIMCFIKYVLRIPLRMTDEQCMVGDYAIHEEESYTFAYYNRNLVQPNPAKGDLESGTVLEGQVVPEQPTRVPEKLARHTKGVTTTEAAASSGNNSSEITSEKPELAA